MTAPGIAAVYWLRTLAVGAGLGVVYGFLRPLRPRLTVLADGLFAAALFCGWVYMTFGICGGDSRLGCTAALFLGILAWEATLGRLLRRAFSLFWQAVGGFFRLCMLPAKKIFQFFMKFYNFLLAKRKKWVTIEGTITKAGKEGARHGKGKALREAGAAQNQPRHQGRYSGGRRAVRGGFGRSVRLH